MIWIHVLIACVCVALVGAIVIALIRYIFGAGYTTIEKLIVVLCVLVALSYVVGGFGVWRAPGLYW